MGVQPLPLDTVGFESKRDQRQPLIWLGIATTERLCAGALLVVLVPFLVLVGFIILVLSRRPPLIAHRRLGQGGRPIWVLKLRTMWEHNSPYPESITFIEHLPADSVSVPDMKARTDPRVTSRFAALCRKYSIDEAPQLWQVVRGDLALVGPRPLTSKELETYYCSDEDELLSTKPGLSGLWQIKGRSRLSYRQRRRLDLFMVRKWSVRLYVTILLETIPTVLTGKNAW